MLNRTIPVEIRLSGTALAAPTACWFNFRMHPEAAPQTLAGLCVARAESHPGHVVVDDGVACLDYASLLDRAGACATRLAEQGVGPGDRVLLVGRNSTDWVVAAFGILLGGGTVVPLGHGSTSGERRAAVEQLAPRLAILEEADGNDLPVTVSALDAATRPGPVAGLPTRDPESPALVMATSGTTGAVKYVAMTNRQLTRLYSWVSRWVGVREDDRFLGAVPLAHSFGLNGVLLIAMFGGAAVRLTPSYDRETLADLVRESRLTVVPGPPTILHDLAAAGAGRVGHTVRLAITGSTEVYADRVRTVCDLLGIPEIVVGYGMTETCGTVALGRVPHRVDSPTCELDVVQGMEVRVVDEDGVVAGPGRPGRLLVRGFNVLHAYAGAGEPATTAEGWFDTGDVGIHDDGRLALVARNKDTVIVSGFNVVPQEVERVLQAHSDVAEVAVVGVADSRQGERLVACVVPVPGAAVDASSLVAHARGHLPGYKVPHDYLCLERLPVTATGKVSRAAVRRVVADGARA